MSTMVSRPLALLGVIAGAGLLLAGSCRSEPKAVDPVAANAAPILPARVGVNLAGLAWYNNQRSFANLVAVSSWHDGWLEAPPPLDARGNIKFLAPRKFAPAMLGLPAGPFKTMRIRCTYAGKGTLNGDGFVRPSQKGRNFADFDFVWPPKLANGWIQVEQTDPADPIRDVDCREPSMPGDAVFAPAFLNSLKGFQLIRFLDWQLTNKNEGGQWSRFAPAGGQFRTSRPEGVRVEDMVLLANQTHSDPWFLMPYNADAEYLGNFARYVHDHLDPGLTAYVELGNEVWNNAFPATQQARKEGVASNLSADQNEAMLRRYSQKSAEALKVWTKIFADNPKRLVRVVSTQNVVSHSAEVVLDFGDTAKFVDALATAPYFQYALKDRTVADLDRIFDDLPGAVNAAMDSAAQNKAIAAKYGKRYIAYEGGQHLLTDDLALALAIQRDPRMGRIYSFYLDQWEKRIGDVMVLYAQTGAIGKYGSWGLREYADQPASEAPKWGAVQKFIAAHPRK